MTIYRFDKFELDSLNFVLKKDNAVIQISQRPIDLLLCLIRYRDNVVDLETLRREVWGSVSLSSSAIPTCIADLRSTLADNPENPSFIRTIRGRGYQFISTVSELTDTTSPPFQKRQELHFAGRSKQLALLTEGHSRTISTQQAELILIRGTAGMGKTRLVNEFLANPNIDQNAYLIHCPEINGAPSYWPWTQFINSAISRRENRTPAFKQHHAALSSVFSEIPPVSDLKISNASQSNKFMMLRHWLEAIRTLARHRPLILIIEDLHRSDTDSIALLSWLTSEVHDRAVLFVATHRPETRKPASESPLTELASCDRVSSIDLQPLDLECIQEILNSEKPDSSDEVCAALLERSAGNPFHLKHLIQDFVTHDPSMSNDTILTHLPSTSTDLVSRILKDLPQSTRALLPACSIDGRTFLATTIGRLSGLSIDNVVNFLDPAIGAGLIRPTTDYESAFEFAHMLVRDAIYNQISSHQRKKLHLSMANILTAECSEEAAPQIAEHLIASIPLGTPARARRFLAIAGTHASSRFAYKEAEGYFNRATKTQTPDDMPTPEERCVLRLNLANAQLYNFRRKRAYNTVLEAAAIARTQKSPELLATCALQLAPDFLSIEVGTHDPTHISLLEESLSAMGERDRKTRSQLLARLSQALHWTDQPEVAKTLAAESMDLARCEQDSNTLASALAATGESMYGPDRVPERLQIIREEGKTLQATGSRSRALVQRNRLIAALLEAGDITSVDESIEDYRIVAREVGLPQYQWYPECYDSMRSTMRGKLRLADKSGARYAEKFAETGDANLFQTRASQHILLQVELGNISEVVPLARKFQSARPRVKSWAAARVWLEWCASNTSSATAILSRFDESSIRNAYSEVGGGAVIAIAAEVSANIRNHALTKLLYELCSAARLRASTIGYGVLYFGSFARYAGLLAHALGKPDEAIEHFEVAIRAEDDRGAHYWKAYAELDLADTLLASQQAPERIQALIASAGSAARNTDLKRLQSRVHKTRALFQEFASDSPL